MRIKRDKDGNRFLTLHGPDQNALDSVDALLATAETRCDNKATAEAAKAAGKALSVFTVRLAEDEAAAGKTPGLPDPPPKPPKK